MNELYNELLNTYCKEVNDTKLVRFYSRLAIPYQYFACVDVWTIKCVMFFF